MSNRKWIHVTKRLPSYCRNVIVTDGEYVSMGWLDHFMDKNGSIYTEWYAPNSSVSENRITHWMSFPKPPRKAQKMPTIKKIQTKWQGLKSIIATLINYIDKKIEQLGEFE